MSIALRVQCDGHDGTCPASAIVARATTPDQARTRVAAWGWIHHDGDDLCPDCKVSGGVRLDVHKSPACTESDHGLCRDPDCRCLCHPDTRGSRTWLLPRIGGAA